MSRGKHARARTWAGAVRSRQKALVGLAVAVVVVGASFVFSAQQAGAAASPTVPGTVTKQAPARPQVHPQARAQAAADAASGLTPFATVTGKVYMSEDAIGTNDPAGGPVLVQKRDASATVEAAYLLAAGTPDYSIQDGDITLNGTSLSFPAANNVTDNFGVNSVWTDVTSIVKPVVDSAPVGNVSFTAAEPSNTQDIDGEILAVIMQDPDLPTDNTVSFEFGALNTNGDTYSIGLAQPLNLDNPNLALTMSIGDSFSYQGPPATGQYSVISVNGTTLTSSAGGNDDSACKYDNPQDFANCGDGELITVGGIGDSTANPPDPNATDSDCAGGPPRCDDELYSLLPFVHNGDTSITVNTSNPSGDDNIFFTGFELDSTVAVVGEGATLSPASGASPVGQPYTLTAKLQDSNGNPIASQPVTFTVVSGPDAGVHQQATTEADGSASFTYSGASVGQDVVQASFTDANGSNQVSNTATVDWTAVAAPTSVSTSLSAGQAAGASVTVPAGTAVTDSATLSGANSATATGSVTYNVYSDAACTKLVQAGSAQTITAGGTLPASVPTTLDTAGTYYWQASYSGDSANEPSVSPCGSETETVTAAATSVPATSLSGGGSSGPSITVPAGTPVTDTATLSGPVASSATGTVTYNVYSDSACTKLASPGLAEPITTEGTLPASAPVTLTTAGTYYWQASYSGDASDQASASACDEVETVTAVAASTSVATSLSGGGKSGTAVSVPAGTPVTDSAALSGANVATATGTVTYSVYSNASCTTLAKPAGSVTVTRGVAPASAAVTLTAPGTYYWQASYSGDSLNGASSSSCGAGGEVETVTAAATTLATSLSGGESSGTAISVPAGTAVTDSATLSGAVASGATGTVTYSVYSDSACTKLVGDGTAQSITTPGALPAAGAVTLTTPGTYYWTASYSGDSGNLASSSGCGTETVSVSPVATPTRLATTLTGGGKTGTAITVPAGTAVTDSATLSGTDAATATGSVTYDVYSDSACTKLVKAGTAEHITTAGTLPASAAVTLSAAGTYYWQVAYSGDASNQAADSTCGAETATVTAASTTLSTSLSGAGHSGTAITVQAGTPVTDLATLSGAVASTATGTVTFSVYSNAACTTLAASGGRQSVSAGKATSVPVTLTVAGTYYWTASYSGDASDLASAATCGAEKLTVTPLPSIDTLTTAWGKGSAAAKVSTGAAGDLVVAFVAATGPGNKHQSSAVSGGGLTWHLVSRQNPGGSDTEVWTATASGKLTSASVTAKASIAGYDVVISMVAFRNASGAGPESFTSSAKGAPHGTLKTTVGNSWVFALGADWATYAAPTAASGQLIISDVDAPGSKTVWLQATNALTAAAGTSVAISDAKPATDPYDLLLVAIH